MYPNLFAYNKALLFLLSQVPNDVLICTAKKKRSDIKISKKSVKTNFIICIQKSFYFHSLHIEKVNIFLVVFKNQP